MRETFLFLITFISINFVSAQNFDYQTDFEKLVEQSKDSISPNNYEKLKAEFIQNGENFTKEKVVALMAGQTASGFYDAYGIIDMERSYQFADKFPSDTIHKYADQFLKIYPTNFSLNYGLWKTYEKDNDKENTERFKKRFKLIAESILSTGDGTNEKPYFVLSPIDGQVLIRLYYGKEIGMMGSGADKHGNFVDVLEIIDGENTKSLNFVIAHAMRLFKQQLQEGEKNDIQKTKIYKHHDFKIAYPESWEVFETKFFEKDIVLRIARKNQINEVYIIPERKGKNGVIDARIIPLNYNKDSINKEYLKYINNPRYLTEYAKNQFNISVEIKKFKTLGKFIMKRKKRIKKISYIKGSFEKVNNNYYINELIIYHDEKNTDSPSITQFHTIHYHYKNNKLYTLIFTSRLDEKDETYAKDFEYIFKSFEFINK